MSLKKKKTLKKLGKREKQWICSLDKFKPGNIYIFTLVKDDIIEYYSMCTIIRTDWLMGYYRFISSFAQDTLSPSFKHLKTFLCPAVWVQQQTLCSRDRTISIFFLLQTFKPCGTKMVCLLSAIQSHSSFLLPVRRYTHTTRAMRHYALPVLYEVPPLLAVAPWRGCFGERKYGVKRDVNTFKTWHFCPVEPKVALQGSEKASSTKVSVRLYVSLRMFAFFVDGVRRALSGGGRRVLDE